MNLVLKKIEVIRGVTELTEAVMRESSLCYLIQRSIQTLGVFSPLGFRVELHLDFINSVNLLGPLVKLLGFSETWSIVTASPSRLTSCRSCENV